MQPGVSATRPISVDLLTETSQRPQLCDVVRQLADSVVELDLEPAGVRRLDAEVEVQQPDLIGAESVIEDIIRAQLIPELEGALAGEDGELATFPLPEVDSSEALNLEPGTASIAVRVEARPDWPSRVEGNNVVYGQLR